MAIPNLAIVIPAYKGNYIEETLESIANQTNKEFTLYIGDDNSPNDIYSFVRKYETQIKIVYKKFDNNLGSKDLVGQWERCIDLSNLNEEWIWLFSDDDVMEPNCVENFYKELTKNYIQYNIYRFHVNIIDETGTIKHTNQYSSFISTEDFLIKRLKGEIYSFAVEYIFRRTVYENREKFQNFPLAWISDDASWLKFSYPNGIKAIADSNVKWRYSGLNITSVYQTETALTKLKACHQYILWLVKWCKKNQLLVNKDLIATWYIKQLGIIGLGGWKLPLKSEIWWLSKTLKMSPFKIITIKLKT